MKNGRWVRIHAEGQNFDTTSNVMDVIAGEARCKAEVVYTANTRTIEKAVYWLLRYLNGAKAQKLQEIIVDELQKKAAEVTESGGERLEAKGEGWNCFVEKLEKGKFKVSIDWLPELEPAEIPVKKVSKKAVKAQTEEIAEPQTEESAEPQTEESAEPQTEETTEPQFEGKKAKKKRKSANKKIKVAA